MKKILAFLLCLVMVMGLLSGCKSSETAPANTPKNEAAAAETAPKTEYVHIPMVFFGTPGSRNIEFFENEFNDRIKEELNITIEVDYLNWGEYEKLEAMLAAGEEFVFMNYGHRVGPYGKKGYMAEITEEQIAEVAPNLVKARMGLDYATCKYRGVNYVIPVGSQAFAGPQENFLIRNDLLNAVGLDYKDIKNFEDLTAAYLKVKEQFPDVRMGYFDRFPCNTEEGDPVVDKQGDPEYIYTDHADADSDKVFGKYTSDFYKKELEQLYTWKELGFYEDEQWITDPNYYHTLWNTGKALIRYGEPIKIIDHTWTGIDGADVQYLEIENNQTIMIYNYDWGWSVSAEGEKYIEPMLRLLNWIYASKENYTFATSGVEGKDWEYAEDGETIVPLVSDEFFYTWQHQTIMFMDKDRYDPEDWERYIAHDSKSIQHKLAGFSFDATPVEVERAAITAVINEYGSWFLYDSYEEWADTVLPKLEEAGYQKYIDEMQKQVSEWWADNH